MRYFRQRGQKTHRMEGSATKTYAIVREKVDIKEPVSEKGGNL